MLHIVRGNLLCNGVKIDLRADDLVVNGRDVWTFRNNGFRVPIAIWIGAKPSGSPRALFVVDVERYPQRVDDRSRPDSTRAEQVRNTTDM